MTITEQKVKTEPQGQSSEAMRQGLWFFPAGLLWMELVLRLSTIGFDYVKGILYTLGFSLAAGLLLCLLGKAFSPKAGRIIMTVLWGILTVFYMGQVVY